MTSELYKYDVSVVIVTYNSDLEKTKATIQSILNQQDVCFEIVIADDGSTDNHSQLIKEFFQKNQFNDYKLIENQKNNGTVKNLITGLREAEGKYTKSISPGDLLYDCHTLRCWVDFMQKTEVLWSFSDAVYYENQKNEAVPIQMPAHPQVIKPYLNQQNTECRWNYVVLDDIALGAALLGDTQLILRYCEKICQYGVIYAEDNIWRLMMFDGIVGGYFQNCTVLYEFGTGISTNNNSVWQERLTNDWLNAERVMDETANPDDFQKSMLKAMRHAKENIFTRFFTRGKINMWFHCHFNKRMTTCKLPK